jgi:hypothetical protein
MEQPQGLMEGSIQAVRWHVWVQCTLNSQWCGVASNVPKKMLPAVVTNSKSASQLLQ